MNKLLYILIISLLFSSCKNETEKKSENKTIEQKEESELSKLIETLTVDDKFNIEDVRRYGLMPDMAVGSHPKTGNKIVDEVISLAENGQKLNFPSGYYKTALNLSQKSNLNLNFEGAFFSGAIIIKGEKDNPSMNIKLKGKIGTYSTFSSSFIEDVTIDSLIIKNDKEKNISKIESSGCNIYSGTLSLYVDYIEIEGIGSESDQFRYTPAALMVHGKSPEPYDIFLKEVVIRSSDRHGAYLSGSSIDIEKLKIMSYGKGKISNLLPIAYTELGDEKKVTGLWLNNFNGSNIDNLEINSENSTQAVDAIYLDKGDANFVSNIIDIKLFGNKKEIRKNPATNVRISD